MYTKEKKLSTEDAWDEMIKHYRPEAIDALIAKAKANGVI